MGKKWDNSGIAYNVDMWKECLRVLKPGGHLLSFGGTRTYHRMAVAIEDAGFEIRDMIEWIYASGFPKSLNIGKAVDKKLGTEYPKNTLMSGNDSMIGGNYTRNTIEIQNEKAKKYEGMGTATKPAHEPICFARKPLSEKTIVDNVLKHGTGGINIDDCRIPYESDDIPKDVKEHYSKRVTTITNDNTPEFKANNQGRFPANIVCQDDALESNSRYFNIDIWAKKNGLLQFPKASKSEKNKGCEGLEEKQTKGGGGQGIGNEDLEKVAHAYGSIKAKHKNNHPTVKPLNLMQYLVTLISKPNDVVLDPFAGSGTTLVAAKELGRKYIGIEMTEEYIPIIEARLNSIENKLI